MGTQGVVSVTKDNQVVLKIVCGSNGNRAQELADAIRKSGKVPSAEEAQEMAQRVGFGGGLDLVVMDSKRELYDDDLSPRYRETFLRPRFNPRWKHGTADHVKVVKF